MDIIRQQQNTKTGAKLALLLLQLSIVAQFISIYQVRKQLASPLVPEGTVLEIMKPLISMGFISAIMGIPALLLYFYGRFLWVIILVCLTLIWQQYFPHLFIG